MSDYKKKWRIKNKEKILKQAEEYRENNKEAIKLYKKQYKEKKQEDWKINGRPTYIYKIQLDNDNLYIGSTYYLPSRKSEHKNKLDTDRLLYNKIRELNCDFKMEIIEEFKTFTNQEKLQKEQDYILSLKPNLNEVKSYITKEEKRLHNLNYMKQDRINNPQKYIEKYEKNKGKNKGKNKEKITCECGSIVLKQVLSRHKKSLKHIKLTECIIVD